MVNYVLRITAELENLIELQPQGGCDDPKFTYYVKLKCGSCGEVGDKEACLTVEDTVPLPTGKGTCHFVRKGTACSVQSRSLPWISSPLVISNSLSFLHQSLMAIVPLCSSSDDSTLPSAAFARLILDPSKSICDKSSMLLLSS
ncbi:OLC1v1029168C1 [Oldenlandia corymbosa var. corymbosa]|uniref:OLC1v1029168C1 n=1 Tax=Oldenlandia corymbosa var. corymbosa TaxID=529605 RepID=A0AAV1CE37_OLDCO|nr:OLC1v1029168C1 [Oldenlandia corymbosa var. corymbosa]